MIGIKIFTITLITTIVSLAWAYFMHWFEKPISGFILSWCLIATFISLISMLVIFRYFNLGISQWNWLVSNSIFFASLLGISMAEVAGKNHVGSDSSMASINMLGGLINGTILGVLAGIVIGYGEKILFSYIKSVNNIQSVFDSFAKGVYIATISGFTIFIFVMALGSIIPKNAYWNSFLQGLLIVILFSPVIGGITGTMSGLSHNIEVT